jgi:hypothetical protein
MCQRTMLGELNYVAPILHHNNILFSSCDIHGKICDVTDRPRRLSMWQTFLEGWIFMMNVTQADVTCHQRR